MTGIRDSEDLQDCQDLKLRLTEWNRLTRMQLALFESGDFGSAEVFADSREELLPCILALAGSSQPADPELSAMCSEALRLNAECSRMLEEKLQQIAGQLRQFGEARTAVCASRPRETATQRFIDSGA